jgi:hypothetical protein
MPFGLMNSPIVFQRLIDKVTQPLRAFTVAYMDDLLIHSASFDEHCTHITAVLSVLTKAELYVKPSKSRFAQKSVKFLGFIVSDSGLMADSKMVQATASFPTPNDPFLSVSKRMARCLQFLGLSDFYRRLTEKLSSVGAPLQKLTLKDAPWVWGAPQENAFKTIKEIMSQAPVLAFADFSLSDNFRVYTDASKIGLGGVLTQVDRKNVERPVYFASRATSKSEKNYPTTALECLSVVYFVTLFNFYLAGRKFVVYTDHSALVWLFSTQRTSMYLRWILRLQAYDFQIKHRSGTQMVVPDALSRNPMSLGTVEPYEEVEPLYSISGTFSSLVMPGGVSLYMQSLSPEAQSQSQSCTICTNISTRPLSFTQMEQHINGRRHLHFLRKAFLHSMSSTKPAHRSKAHHAHAINTTALHLLARAEQIFESHSSRRGTVSPDRYFTDTPTPVPRITLAVITRSGSRTMAASPVPKRVPIQRKKASASPMVDTSSPPPSFTSVPAPLPSGPVSSHETHTNIVDPPAVVEKPQSLLVDSKVTCKQCGQSCPISAFSPSQLRQWEANSVCRSCLVKLEKPLDTPALLENPFLAPQVVAPDPRFILADNSDPMSQRLPARPIDNIEVDPDFQHAALNKWMVAQRADSILKQIIDFIAKGKVDKGTTLTAIREHSLPYSIDRGVLMRRVMYRKEEITAVVVPFVFQEFLLKIFHNNPHSAHLGARKMLARLSSRFYWLGMTQDCECWVAACMECRSRKSVQDHRAGLPGVVPRALQPGDLIGMDLVGPFTKSPSGNTYLLILISV